MPDIRDDRRVEMASALTFELTVTRLTQAIEKAGMSIFAIIDHARNATAAGLSTPLMIAAPRSALDLPLHVLVREEPEGRTLVSFHPIAPLMQAAGVPADLAGSLEPAQALLLKAIAP
jgi:uncharacterized protein (DUF302 family)